MKVWNFSRNGKLVITAEVADMNEARTLAARWNDGEDRKEMKIEIISNGPVPAHATKVCAAYDPSPLPLFGEG